MNILAFSPKNHSPSYHRVVMPLMLMDGPDVFCTNAPKEEHFAKSDVFVFNRILPDGGLEGLLKMRAKYGFRIVCDVDDWWYLDPHHILYDEYQETEFARRQIEHLRASDIVTTTHERLAESIRDVVKYDVHVCPNAIPRKGQFNIDREASEYSRLFWQGSSTHERDIEILERPIAGLGPLSPKIKMVMAGFNQEGEEWHRMAQIYTANLKHQYKLIQGEPVTSYYQAYKHADICLVPLLNSPFNRMKSNLKILEAANMGFPVIASQVDPYLDMPLLYARSGSDWVKHITRLVKSKKRQKEAGEELAEFCREHYDFNKINNQRRQILEYVATKAGA